MKARIIRTEIGKSGVIHIVDYELPPGEADVVVLFHDTELSQPSALDVNDLPLGGYKADRLSPEHLGREVIYEEG